jgi:hypothetical protein
MEIVIIRKVVKHVQKIVEHVQHQTLVGMVSAMPQQKHVLVAQKTVELVLHPLTQFVGMEHVILEKIVTHVLMIVLDLVHVLKEKCEMIRMYV